LSIHEAVSIRRSILLELELLLKEITAMQKGEQKWISWSL